MKRFLFVCLLFVSVLCPEAFCQRQVPGRSSVEAYALWGGARPSGIGCLYGGAAWRRYNYGGNFSLGLDVTGVPLTYVYEEEPVYDSAGEMVSPGSKEEFSLMPVDIVAAAGYMFRLLSTRNRSVVLSAGGSVQNGVRVVSYGDGNPSGVGYCMHLCPEVQFEVFPSGSLSVMLSARLCANVINTLGGSSPWLRFYVGTGIKYYL